ncbi:MAG: hypothetical protein RLP02_17545 [Coleofasciculus sp. C2-GNP5-27]
MIKTNRKLSSQFSASSKLAGTSLNIVTVVAHEYLPKAFSWFSDKKKLEFFWHE